MGRYDPSLVCFDCEVTSTVIKVIKPARSRHCEVCKSCIMVYDHHCPWINNCVGAKNYIWFFLFIITMEINLIFSLVY